MKIRQLRKEDIKEIAPLMLDLYKKWDKIDPIDRIDKGWFCSNKHYNYLRKIINDRKHLFLVVEIDKKIVAYLLAKFEKRKPFLQKTGYIAETYTNFKYRGNGIASALLKRVFVWFKKNNLRWLVVETHSIDQGAISFWQNRGFEEFNKCFKLKSL